MFPGCGMVAHVSVNKFDPLLIPLKCGIAKPDMKQLVYQQVRERTGSSQQAQKRTQKAVDLRRAVCAEDGKSCEFG